MAVRNDYRYQINRLGYRFHTKISNCRGEKDMERALACLENAMGRRPTAEQAAVLIPGLKSAASAETPNP